MIIFENFLDWAESRFPGEVRVSGNEVQINSIFTEKPDRDHKLWCNPYGGKNQREHGVFHCWKTDRHGSLVSLVMLVDKCDYDVAVGILGGEETAIRDLEKQLEEFWAKKDEKPVEVAEEKPVLELPSFSCPIAELPSFSRHRVKAELYLVNRKLPTEDLLICTRGRYRERIIIPYYNREHELIYFNSRYIGDKENMVRYLGPPKEAGVGKNDVLYIPKWAPDGEKLYLTEGEFDALSIYYSGIIQREKIYAAAFGGKNLSDKQLGMIQHHQICLCLDSDTAGKLGLKKMVEKLRARGIPLTFVRPPKQYKDWNKMLVEVGHKILLHYLRTYEKPMTDMYLLNLLD